MKPDTTRLRDLYDRFNDPAAEITGPYHVGDMDREEPYRKWFPVMSSCHDPVALFPTYDDAYAFVRFVNGEDDAAQCVRLAELLREAKSEIMCHLCCQPGEYVRIVDRITAALAELEKKP